MGKRSIVEYVKSLDRDGLKRLNDRIDRYEQNSRRYTWDGFLEIHFDRTTLWGWCNTIFTVLGTATGLVYGLWSSIDNWQGILWLLMVTAFATLVGWVAGMFTAAALIGVAIVAVLGGGIWLIVRVASLF